jgi:hypothetical protein
MNTPIIPSDQEAFIKAISDENRLKLIGVLAEGNASASDLSVRTQLHPAQVARHLELLLQAGVVVTRQTEAGIVYELDTRYVEAIARQRLAAIRKTADIPEGKYSPEDRKIVLNYTRSDGRLKQIPMQTKKIQAVLNYIYDAFDKERRYTEKDVNEILARFHPDTSTLRRYLVDFQYLERERDGSVYWCKR